MTTADQFALFTDKRVTGFEDFSLRLLDYLRGNTREAIQRQFPQGSFSERMPISSPGSNQVQVDLKAVLQDGYCHDGNGHLLDLEQISRVAVFENTAAQVYEIGAAYVEYPFEVRINQRTSKVEYDRMVEGVGVEATPNSVIDNGNGTITMRVDTLFEQGVAVGNHAGRIVRVWRKVIAEGATTASVAIEERTVFYGGGQNQITTSAAFGQTTVSTTPADYVVQLVGIIVLKDTATNRPTQNPSTQFFAGTVTGNGGVPVTFDNSGQALIEAQSASGISFTPYATAGVSAWSVTSTDVQSVIQEIMDDLNTDAAFSGADKIGVDPTSFNQEDPSETLAWGGLAGYTTPARAQHILEEVDRMICRSRFGITYSDDGDAGDKSSGLLDWPNFDDMQHWLKGAPAADFSTNFGQWGSALGWPTTQGESPNKTILRHDSSSTSFEVFGTYRDLAMVATNAGQIVAGGFERGPFIAERCIIAPNTMRVTGGEDVGGSTVTPLDDLQPCILRDCHVPHQPYLGGNGSNASGIEFVNTLGGVRAIENCVFKNGSSGPTATIAGTNDKERTTVFRNCIFYQNNSGEPVIDVTGGNPVFIDCAVFKDNDDDDAPAIASVGTVTFIGGSVHSNNGNLFHGTRLDTHRGFWTTQNSASTGATSPQALLVNASGSFRARMYGTHFSAGASSTRDDADRAVYEMTNVDMNDCRFEIGNSGSVPGHNYMHYNLSGCNGSNNTILGQLGEITTNPYPAGHQIMLLNSCELFGGTISCSFYAPATDALANGSSGLRLTGLTILTGVYLSLGTNIDVSQLGLPEHNLAVDGFDSRVIDCRMQSVTFRVAAGGSFIGLNGNENVVRNLHASGFIRWDVTDGLSTTFLKIDADNVEVEGIVTDDNVNNNVDLVEIAGGNNIRIDNVNFVQGTAALATRRMIYNSSATAHTIRVTRAILRWASGGNNPANDRWIDLSSAGGGDQSLVDQCQLLNGQATVPAIQNAGTASLSGTNMLIGSATI